MHATATLAVLLSMLPGTAAVAEAQRLDVPIIVGGEQLDACGSVAEVREALLVVRSGPGANHREVDRLHRGARVILCGEQGDWYAAIYSSEPQQNCRIGEPYPKVGPYTGPCRAGWIFSGHVEIIVG